ncbi:hypothetical protein [Oceanobacillus kimchii]|uniref:t-SNARE coiled-coil homology domain-containing protein n=1 Tax=Oceanobacillus kimchii TaxID=746691 RepID=A0ABQ5TKA4_9BACI|nr:hypothetical protein [Oceanobacillus kimchii]GLO66119.1 hypothetical protein MACH08_19030 [Oceanobacillus kimchii]
MDENGNYIRLDQRITDMERRVTIVEQETKPIDRIITLMEMNQEQDKKRDEQFDRMVKTMQDMSISIASVNGDIREIKNDITYVKDDVENASKEIDTLKKEDKSRLEKHKTRGIDFKWKLYFWIITFALAAILTIWFKL